MTDRGSNEGASGGTAHPTSRARARLANLALLLVSSALVLGAGEWFLRHYLPTGGFLYRLDPRYHYTLAPHARTLFVHSAANGGGTILVTTNSEGFRGGELRRGEPRIVVFGDSCIEADYSRLSETFSRRLEVRLRAATGRGVEAVNAGVNGYGPDQALRRFQDEVGRLRPVGIVFTVFADNDFGDLLRNRLYRLEGDRLVEAGGVLAGPARRMFDPTGRGGGLETWKRLRQLFRRTESAPVSREEVEERRAGALARYVVRSEEMCAREYERVVVRRDTVISGLFKDHYDADVALHPRSEAAGYKRRLFAAVLRAVARTAREARVRVLVLVVPSPIDVCTDYEIRVDRDRFPEYDPQRLSAEATRAATEANLPVLDLFESFRAAGARGLYYRPPGEDHWNAAGQDLAARLASDRIMAEGWLEPVDDADRRL